MAEKRPETPPNMSLAVAGNGPPHHSRYYIEDQMSIFKVDGTLFKVHCHLLSQECGFLKDMFSLPQPATTPCEGQSDENPITLNNVSSSEFTSLLDYIYGRAYDTPAYRPTSQSFAVGTKGKGQDTEVDHPPHPLQSSFDLLSIASYFDCPRAKQHAIATIDASTISIDPVHRIVLSRDHLVEHWELPAYVAICQRVEPLSLEEGCKLGMHSYNLVVKARELVRYEASLQNQREPPFTAATVEIAVKEVLASRF